MEEQVCTGELGFPLGHLQEQSLPTKPSPGQSKVGQDAERRS